MGGWQCRVNPIRPSEVELGRLNAQRCGDFDARASANGCFAFKLCVGTLCDAHALGYFSLCHAEVVPPSPCGGEAVPNGAFHDGGRNARFV